MRNPRLKSINRLYLFSHVLLLFIACIGCSNIETVSLPVHKSGHFQQDRFRFIVAADPQLFRGKKEDLDKAILSINDFEPEFVVMCGDLVETSSNQQQIQAYKDSVAKLSPEITLYNLPGNHDLGLPVKIENILVYQENFGKLWFHFTNGKNLFVVLSSDILRDNDAPMNKQQKASLTNTLEQFESKAVSNIFVFMHHPLYLNSPDEPDAYSNMPGEIRRDLLDLFVKHKVQTVYSGHLHDNKINSYQGVDLITINSITVPMGKTPAGFRIVDVHQDEYEDRYFTIEQFNKQERMN